jgi:Extracellular link domain
MNASRLSSTESYSVSSLFSGWTSVILAILVLVILFAVYYQTIGYYIQLGWDKLSWSKKHGETIEIDAPGGVSAQLTPAAPSPSTGDSSGAPLGTGLGKVLGSLESDVATALGEGGSGGHKQVFNVSRNIYRFSEAEPLCRAFGAELATYDQVKDAYKAGADWCNYGWVKGQLAVYPTQKETYEKLQHGPKEDRMMCGLPGVNGGYFPNEDQRFGVNCYGPKPAESALDERLQREETSNIAFDREVNNFKAELDSIAVSPWSSKQWTA